MTGFEPGSSGIGSDHGVNCATTTAHLCLVVSLFLSSTNDIINSDFSSEGVNWLGENSLSLGPEVASSNPVFKKSNVSHLGFELVDALIPDVARKLSYGSLWFSVALAFFLFQRYRVCGVKLDFLFLSLPLTNFFHFYPILILCFTTYAQLFWILNMKSVLMYDASRQSNVPSLLDNKEYIFCS